MQSGCALFVIFNYIMNHEFISGISWSIGSHDTGKQNGTAWYRYGEGKILEKLRHDTSKTRYLIHTQYMCYNIFFLQFFFVILSKLIKKYNTMPIQN